MHSLDDLKLIKKYDKSGMLETIESFPIQCEDAKNIGSALRLPDSYRIPYYNIVCAGLGGSAAGADILRSYLWDEAKVPLFVNRNYLLPAFVDDRTLVVVSSYSGDTEETISAYRCARKKGAKVVAITSNGLLRKLAGEDNIPVIPIPKGLQPRCAIGYLFFPLLILLSKTSLVKNKARDIDETIKILDEIKRNKTGFDVPEKKNIAKQIASSLYGKYPVIYASQDYMDCAVTRWRAELAENAKTLSSGHLFPEMNHNEIVGWQNPAKVLKDFTAIVLRDDVFDHPRISRRMDITTEILKKEGVKTIDVKPSGRSRLARIFSLIYTGDFVSYYSALLNRIDPAPVDRITYLKKALKK